MQRVNLLISSLIIILVITSGTNYGQTYGKLYTKSQGEQLYGAVVKSVQISTLEVSSFLTKTDKVMMFNINDNKLFILGDGRKPIYPSNAMVDEKEVFAVYSTSIIYELLNKGNSSTTYFEKRNNVLTITNGEFLLEFAEHCPPLCP